MKIIYKSDYLSIKEFNPIETPDFMVLTGMNGSGKTHLLEAIRQGNVFIQNHEDDPVVYFDYKTFFLENEAEFNAYQIASEKENAWNYFTQQIKNNVESYKNNLGQNYQSICNFCTNHDVGILDIGTNDFSDYADELQELERYQEYKRNVQNLFEKNDSYRNNEQAKAIYVLLKKLKSSIDEIDKETFIDKFRPYIFKNDFLPQQLGKIIWDYYVRWDGNDYRRYLNTQKDKKHKVFSEEDFFITYGQKPWLVINQILEKFGSLKYRVNNPEDLDLGREDRYKLTLNNIENETAIDFSSLSSGEKVLMALVASIYKSSSDKHFPKILLLDEIDASLHPSMIQNLLEVVNEVFIKNDTKVILVTHSPTTVAIAPEESVYVMEHSGKERLMKKTKSEALSLLTEGFATLEEGIKLFDEVSKKNTVIITEGNNSKLIEKILEIEKIADVDVVKGAEGKSGDTQLKTIFDFFALVPHDKKVIFVWDCDTKVTGSDSTNTYYFKFPKNSQNSVAKKGVENLFPVELFTDEFTVKITSSEKSKVYFDENKKREFESLILTRNNKADFANFKSLLEKIDAVKKI